MQPEQKKVCDGECGQCEIREASKCCNQWPMKVEYSMNSSGTNFVCTMCDRRCLSVIQIKTPQFVSMTFESGQELAAFLNKYNQYHDFDIVSQKNTPYSGFLGLGGGILYSITLKNK